MRYGTDLPGPPTRLPQPQGAKLVYDLADVFYYYLKPEAVPSFPDRHGKRPAHMIALGRTASQAPGGGADKRAKTRSGQTPGRAPSSASNASSSHSPSSSSSSSPTSIWGEGEGPVAQPVEMTVAYFREGTSREVRTELHDDAVLADAMEGRYWRAKEGEIFMGTFQVRWESGSSMTVAAAANAANANAAAAANAIVLF
jgi:hypothetical protein